MKEKKRFLLRLDDDLYAVLEKWAGDELRSVNAQIEYLLTDAVRRAKRARSVRPPAAERSESPARTDEENQGGVGQTG